MIINKDNQSSRPIPQDSSNITFLYCLYPLEDQAPRLFFVCAPMPNKKKQKQQPNAMETPSASPAREANANTSTVSNDDTPTSNTKASIILAAINDMSKRMEVQFNKLGASLQATQASLTEHDARISTLEAASSDHDIRLT